MTTETTLKHPQDFWIRWWWVWPTAFQILLVVALGFAWVDVDHPTMPLSRYRGLILLLSVLASAWNFGCNIYASRNPTMWREMALVPMFVFNGVSITLWFLLASLHPVFNLVLFVVYGQVFATLPTKLALSTAIFLGVLNYIVLFGLTFNQTGISNFVVIITFATLFSLWIAGIIKQSSGRRELLEQLQQTQLELATKEREAGRLAERDRLAREIHDTLAQGFTSIVMHLEAAEQNTTNTQLPEQTAHHITVAKETARHSLQQAREVVADLRPDLLTKQSLPSALERTVTKWAQTTQLSASFVQTGEERPLSTDMDVTLLRATQESLANVRKHAQAKHVTVTLSYMSDRVILDVQDDGIGFDPHADTGGFGLTAMRERVAEHGGTIDVETEIEDGTTIVVTLPSL